ncbi:hypothetical protein HDV00_007930 [Rhizophlyctis rosea]|nr:hypothetical protein HDV00_007930 [Rhizophlyctis rosea]
MSIFHVGIYPTKDNLLPDLHLRLDHLASNQTKYHADNAANLADLSPNLDALASTVNNRNLAFFANIHLKLDTIATSLRTLYAFSHNNSDMTDLMLKLDAVLNTTNERKQHKEECSRIPGPDIIYRIPRNKTCDTLCWQSHNITQPYTLTAIHTNLTNGFPLFICRAMHIDGSIYLGKAGTATNNHCTYNTSQTLFHSFTYDIPIGDQTLVEDIVSINFLTPTPLVLSHLVL